MFSCASEYQQALQNAFAGEDISVFAYRELDSTNTEAKRLALGGGNAPAVIAAESQTAGRGRMGRSFYSPLQTGAYFSFLYQPSAGLDVAVSVTSAVSVAVAEAILALCGVQCEIKWVNDLYCNGKKVCGILCESVTVGESVKSFTTIELAPLIQKYAMQIGMVAFEKFSFFPMSGITVAIINKTVEIIA